MGVGARRGSPVTACGVRDGRWQHGGRGLRVIIAVGWRYWEWQIRGEGRALAYVQRLHGRRPRDAEIGSGRSGVIREILALRDPWMPVGYGGGAWALSSGVGARSMPGLLVVGVEMSG